MNSTPSLRYVDVGLLRQARSSRNEDACIRATMGLSYTGLIYITEDFRASPLSLFRACDGVEYVKVASAKYVRLDLFRAGARES